MDARGRYQDLIEDQAGHAMSDVEWLDKHGTACAEGYRRCVDLASLPSGCSLLDAGCGNGFYLPWLAETVGPAGSIVAVDNVPRNLAEVSRRLEQQWSLPCRVEVQAGDLLDLGMRGRFDAIFCANVSELLTDAQLDTMLIGFKQALKPEGGVIVLKSFDGQVLRFVPEALQRVIFRVYERVQGSGHPFEAFAHSIRRIPSLRFVFRRHGLTSIEHHDVAIEHVAPLPDHKRRWAYEFGGIYAKVARDLEMPRADIDLLESLEDPNHPDNPAHRDEFLFTEMSTVTRGIVAPGRGFGGSAR